LVADGEGVAAAEEPPGGVGGREELAGPEELEARAFPASLALRVLVTSCILLNISWLLIISAQQIKTDELVKSLEIKLFYETCKT
jgi:hypothetical protein